MKPYYRKERIIITQLRTLIVAVNAAVTLHRAVKDIRITRRMSVAHRRAIRLNKQLDLMAIDRAQKLVSARTRAGYYRSVAAVTHDLSVEIDRQKILVRNEL